MKRTAEQLIALTPATRDAVEDELLHVLNRWARAYPARLIKDRPGACTQQGRVKQMHRDIGFLLHLVGKAIQESESEP